MKKIIKLTLLTISIISITACGKMGALEKAKPTSLTMLSIAHTV